MASTNLQKAKTASPAPKRKSRPTGGENKIYRMIGEVDRPLLIVVIALVCIGSIMIFSASYSAGDSRFNDSYYFARSQLRWVILGITGMIVLSRVDYAYYKRLAYMFYGGMLIVNFLVPRFGETHKGAKRWIEVMGIEFQPSEFLKFALVLACATYISNHVNEMRDWKKGIVPIMMFTAPACLATFLQNHMSATIIIFLLGIVMLWFSGVKSFYFGALFGFVGVAIAFAFSIGRPLLEKFVPQIFPRLMVFEDPFAYMSAETGGAGWQPAQSLYAISSGGFWGLGLGQSNQKHGYLPEPQNDYIFAILSEELGFFGVICVITLFAVLAYRGYHISKNSTNRFCALLSMGITCQIIVQVLLNLAVVTNTFPSTGISLPFFSYGGTSLFILLAEMGIVLSISRYSLVERG